MSQWSEHEKLIGNTTFMAHVEGECWQKVMPGDKIDFVRVHRITLGQPVTEEEVEAAQKFIGRPHADWEAQSAPALKMHPDIPSEIPNTKNRAKNLKTEPINSLQVIDK